MAKTECQASGLGIKANDCDITSTIRAGMYASELKPTDDDVIAVVVAVREDLIEPRDKEIERLRSNLSMALDLKHKRELELKRLRSRFCENEQRIADELAD